MVGEVNTCDVTCDCHLDSVKIREEEAVVMFCLEKRDGCGRVILKQRDKAEERYSERRERERNRTKEGRHW